MGVLSACLLLAGLAGLAGGRPASAAPDPIPEDARGPYPVLYVSDGDTFAITRRDKSGKRITEVIRVLSLDTPETKKPFAPKECYGEQASRRAEKLLTGRKVRLEGDPAAGKLDKYGRRLAHVWLPDGTLFARRMVRGGYGRYDWIRGRWLIHDKQVKAAQDRARAEQAGLWAPKACNGDGHKPLS